MKHEPILAERQSPPLDLGPLERSAVATIGRAIGLAMAVVALVAPASVLLAGHLSGLPLSGTVLAVAGAALTAAAICAIVTTRLAAKAIAGVAVRPVEFLLSHFAETTNDYRWNCGRALSLADTRHDLAALHRQVRLAGRRTQRLIAEFDQARERATRQDMAQSQFLTNMSHELRTPLNAILGYAMLLHEDAAEARDTSAMADLERIQQAGRNLLGIINDILDLAKLETGKTALERNVIDVNALLRSTAESYQSPAERHGNALTWHGPDDTTLMIGDEGKIVQCLNHLLGNAFKFTAKGNIQLRAAPIERAGRKWIEFEVRDDGIGIDENDLDHLFDAFHQIDGSSTRQQGGMGYGLAIVRQLARAMDGDCTVESRAGQGSVFRLKLPAGEAAEGLTARTVPESPASSAFSAAPSARHTALVIDDDDAALDLLRRWLARTGYNAITTTDGETGVKLARQHKPDLILLDALLPGRSGYELAEELRGDPETARIPTILITVDDDRMRGLRCGATDYMRKPITEQQLRDVIDVYRGRVAGDVLVIEDDDNSADLVARCVAQVGFSSRRANDGIEGLALAAQKRPDAIVLDLAMPSMNGFEVLDRLAADEGLRDVPLIVVSGAEISLEEHTRLARAGLRFLPKGASTPREIAQSLKELVA